MTTLITRRSILRSLFAAPATIAAGTLMPISMKPLMPPKLWGDGIHDDTEAIAWMIERAAKTGGIVYIPNGTYRVSSRWTEPATRS